MEKTPKETAGPEFYLILTKNLAKVVGPIARMLVDEYLDEMGESRGSLPRSRTSELVSKLSVEIANPAQQEEFINSMSEFTK